MAIIHRGYAPFQNKSINQTARLRWMIPQRNHSQTRWWQVKVVTIKYE